MDVRHWRNSTALSPIGEIPKDTLAKVRWTFAGCDGPIFTRNTYESKSQSNWRNSSRSVGERTVDFRQLAKFQSSLGDSLNGEMRNPQQKLLCYYVRYDFQDTTSDVSSSTILFRTSS